MTDGSLVDYSYGGWHDQYQVGRQMRYIGGTKKKMKPYSAIYV